MNDPREKYRLAAKVDAPAWVTQYLRPLLSGSERILDVGCGPGVIAAEVARQFPGAGVVGLDRSDDRLNEARRNLEPFSNAAARPGDASRLPLEDASFGFVYSRFLLEYLPDKPQAVREMVRVLRPGGRLLLQDLDGQLLWHFPTDNELQPAIEKVVGALAETGFDPFVGRKLYHYCFQAGLQNLSVQAHSYHLFAGPIDETNRRLWELKVDIALPLAAKALGGEQAALDFKRRFLDYLERPDTLTYSVVFTVVGVKPRLAQRQDRAIRREVEDL
jgi:ubiquinone/menaquinone biosynthesis C-methylase UbiE